MSSIRFEDGQVILGNTTLPGFFVSSRVGKVLRFDDQKNDNKSGKRKVPLGWEDADVTITLELTTDDEGTDCYDKLEQITAEFMSYDLQANPQIFDIDNRHLSARGVRQVLFSSLDSAETNQDDTIQVTLSFSEYMQPVVKLETDVAKGGTATKKKAKPTAEPDIMVDLT